MVLLVICIVLVARAHSLATVLKGMNTLCRGATSPHLPFLGTPALLYCNDSMLLARRLARLFDQEASNNPAIPVYAC